MSDEPAAALLQEVFDLAVAGGSATRGEFIPKPFVVRHGGYEIRVDYSAGSSKDVSLDAHYDTVARADHPSARGHRAPRDEERHADRHLGDGSFADDPRSTMAAVANGTRNVASKPSDHVATPSRSRVAPSTARPTPPSPAVQAIDDLRGPRDSVHPST